MPNHVCAAVRRRAPEHLVKNGSFSSTLRAVITTERHKSRESLPQKKDGLAEVPRTDVPTQVAETLAAHHREIRVSPIRVDLNTAVEREQGLAGHRLVNYG